MFEGAVFGGVGATKGRDVLPKGMQVAVLPVKGYFADKKTPTHLGPPQDPLRTVCTGLR